jgi:hypothetical protein
MQLVNHIGRQATGKNGREARKIPPSHMILRLN